MINRAPSGWRHNPSNFSRRARNASAAAIAALLVLRLEATPPALATSSAVVLVVCGALSLIGDSHRWSEKPWLVALLGFLAIPVSLIDTALVTIAQVAVGRVDAFELAFIGLTCALAGSVLDENLASAQCIRSRSDRGHSLWKALFGMRSRRRGGRSVTLDDVLSREEGRR